MKRKFVKLIAMFVIATFLFNTTAFAVETSSTEASVKISEDVSAKLVEMSDDEKISVYIYFTDTSDSVLSTMKSNYSDLYATYVAATGETDSFSSSLLTVDAAKAETDEQKEMVQASIQVKRDLYNDHYSSANRSILKKYCSDDDILFVSSYAPMVIASVTRSELKQLMADSSVTNISLFEDKELSVSSLINGNLSSRATYVRDTLGNRGYGVKIGQIEPAVPNTSDSYLASANITTNTSFGGNLSSANVDHATIVARIMVGSTGVAPSASLYSASVGSLESVYNAVDWLISKGVNVINMSANFYGWHGYDAFCAYIDHLAVQHDVHFVVTSGNNDVRDPNYYVCSPGMAYNAITVGAYHDNSTAPANDTQIYAKQKDDYIETYSKYLEGDATDRPCKPNLVASGNDFWGQSGTSFAAPQVTGVIAQLCSYNSSLKTKQTCMGAILAASCGRKIASEVQTGTEIVSSGSFKGGKFTSSASVALSGNQISNIQGAGKLDAYWARTIVASGYYWSATLSASTTIHTQNVYITKGSETLTRVALYWLKRNTVDSQNNVTEIDMPDWDLKVYGPDGSLIASSTTYYSNFEIVQFVPPSSGTYQIEIRRVDSSYDEKSNIGLAVW